MRVVTFGIRASELTTAALEAVGEVEEAEHVGHVEEGDASFVPNPNSAAGLRTLSELRPDLFLSSGYGLILREPALAIPRIGAINMHPSLLPAYRGSRPIFWAMYEGQRQVGTTIHEMVSCVDAGGILAQRALEVDPADDPRDAYRRVLALAKPSLVAVLRELAATRTLAASPQSGGGCYRSVPWKELERLEFDWSLSASEIVRRAQVFQDWVNVPVRGDRIFVRSVREVLATGDHRPPGSVLRRRLDGLTVAAGEGEAVALDGLRRRRAGSSRTARVRSLALGWRLPGRLAGGAAR